MARKKKAKAKRNTEILPEAQLLYEAVLNGDNQEHIALLTTFLDALPVNKAGYDIWEKVQRGDGEEHESYPLEFWWEVQGSCHQLEACKEAALPAIVKRLEEKLYLPFRMELVTLLSGYLQYQDIRPIFTRNLSWVISSCSRFDPWTEYLLMDALKLCRDSAKTLGPECADLMPSVENQTRSGFDGSEVSNRSRYTYNVLAKEAPMRLLNQMEELVFNEMGDEIHDILPYSNKEMKAIKKLVKEKGSEELKNFFKDLS